MKRKLPHTRTEAAAPSEAAHLTRGQQTAMELGEEAQHTIGPRKEKLIKRATQLGKEQGSRS